MATMTKKSFKHGELIVINYQEKGKTTTVHAKVVRHRDDRMNVFAQGRLMWINTSQYVGPADKNTVDLTRGSVATLKQNMRDLAMPKKTITENHERALDIIRKHPGSTVEKISDLIGKSTPATVLIVSQLETMGFVSHVMDAEKRAAFSATESGMAHTIGTHADNKITKLKTDKSGEVTVSKKERVLALLKNKELTVAQIAELTGAAPSYIRGVRERSSKKMDEPEKGTIKRKVYDALRRGMSLSETASECAVTVSYAYQVRQQMINAKII